MLMTIDVGNTNITVGIFDKQKLVGNFRLTTGMTRTSDEFGTAIGEILRYNDIEKQDISDAIIASVVPKIMHSLTSGIIKYFEVHPILVEPGVRTGVKIITDNPRQIGADRIVNAAGAQLMGIGCAVEKGFQGGGDRLRAAGFNLKSLAIIESAEPGHIVFRDDD